MEGWTPNATNAPTFSPHGRLSPKRPFTGGRITEKDVLSLCEAAEMASRHAGTEVTKGDFIRAAARAEITLKVVCPRAAVMRSLLPGGQNLPIPSGGLVNLPWSAAQGLAATGTARWRTIDGVRTANELGPPMSLLFEGQIGFFDEWALAPDEPDLVATREDCRVSGVYVMALADAFLDARLGPSEPGTLDAAPETKTATMVSKRPTTPPPLPTPKIADAFDGIADATAEQWRKRLGDVGNHRWLLAARAEAAVPPAAATWWPIILAKLLLEREPPTHDSLNRKFLHEPALKPWLTDWQELRRERNAFGD